MANLVEVTDEQFSSLIESHYGPLLIDFWAPWCSYCLQITPVLNEVADELAGHVQCVKLNVDDHAHLAEQYGVMMLPTIILTVHGNEVERLVGVVDKAEILEKLAAYS